MKKLVLTMAIALGMVFTANAQRAGIDYDYSNGHYDGVNNYNYGDWHRIEDYGDRHYVGSHFNNDDEKDDVLTRLGLKSSSSTTSRGAEYNGYEGESYLGGDLLSRGKKGGGLFGFGAVSDESSYGASFIDGSTLPLLPSHFNNDNQDAAPLGSGALLLIGFGAAYALGKKSKK